MQFICYTTSPAADAYLGCMALDCIEKFMIIFI